MLIKGIIAAGHVGQNFQAFIKTCYVFWTTLTTVNILLYKNPFMYINLWHFPTPLILLLSMEC